MNEKGYNGWTNYETWAVALWIDNEQASYRRWREAAAEAAQEAPGCRQVADGIWKREEAVRFLLADWLKEEISDVAPTDEPNVFSDLLNAALEQVDWQEIADHLLADTAESEPEPEQIVQQPAVISAYSRVQAIEDGQLIDVSETAQEAGIRFPTAVTAAAWGRYVQVPEGVQAQDEGGRLWDVLWMLRCAILGSESGPKDRVDFQVFVRNDNGSPKRVTLKAMCGPGDDAQPVITVMLPDED